MSTVRETQYGFIWDQVTVSRYASLDDGRKCIGIETDFGKVVVYVSPTGRSVRVFKDNDREMTVGGAG